MRKLVLLLAVAVMACLVASPVFAAEAKKDLKIGFIYVSPVGDEGWSYAHDLARKELEAMPGVTTSFVESVPEGPDAERVILKMARQGYDIIFATSFGYMDAMQKVAKQFPKTTFMHCSGYKTAPNMSNYFGRIYQARYVTGLVAGSMTKKNVIGYVAAFPIPEVIRGINAFTLGVRAVNPKAEVRVVWTKTWYDPALEKEGAKSLLDVGADVITQHQDTPGPMQAAQEKGKFGIGYNTDMSKMAPKAVMTSPVWNWGPYYVKIVEGVKNKTWKNEQYWGSMKENVVDLAPFGPMVPEETKKLVADAKKKIVDGSWDVFWGPVKDQTGAVKIAAGQKMSDADMLSFNWFVEGVEGTISK